METDESAGTSGSIQAKFLILLETQTMAQQHYRFEENSHLSMKSLMYYHMTFHFSKRIHINHAIFGHLYLLGVFLLFDAINWIANVIVCAIYCALFLFIFRFNIIAWIYAVIIALVAFSAHALHEYYLSNMDEYVAFIVGGSCVIFSLLSQQIGHLIHEKYKAPISLFHGFVAAPFLEFMSYFILLDCKRIYPAQLRGIEQAVHERRNKLKGIIDLNAHH